MPKRNMRIGGYAGAGRWCAVLSLGASKRGAYWQPYWVCAVVWWHRAWRRRVINGWVFPCAVTWGCGKGKRLAGWELTRQNVLVEHTGLSRRAGETRGVSRTRHKVRGCDLS